MKMWPQLFMLLLLSLHVDLVPVLLQEVLVADAQHVGDEEAHAQCVQTECNDDKFDKMIAVLEQQFAAQMQLLKDLVKCKCSRLGEEVKVEDDTKEPTVEQLLPGSTGTRTGKAFFNAPSHIEVPSHGHGQVSPPSSSLPTTIPQLTGEGHPTTAEEGAEASQPRPRPDPFPDPRTFQIFAECDDGVCPSIHRVYQKQRFSDPSDKLSLDPPHDQNMKNEMLVESFPPFLESPSEDESVEPELIEEISQMSTTEAELPPLLTLLFAGGMEEGLKPKQSFIRTTFPHPRRSTASTNSPQRSARTSKTTQQDAPDMHEEQVTPAPNWDRIEQTTTQAPRKTISSSFSIFPKCDGDCYTFPQAIVKQ